MSRSWIAIERLAVGLGVKPDTIRKWRVRGVPRAWRFDLARADERHEIDTADFDRPPGPGPRGRPRIKRAA